MRKSRRANGRFSEINMTPLIDMTFLLLVTFIITMPAMEQGITVRLPQGSTDKLEHKDKPLTVTLDEKGKTYLGKQPVTFSELETALGERATQNPNTAVLVRADERLDYGEVMKVMKLLYKVKITKMALVTLAD